MVFTLSIVLSSGYTADLIVISFHSHDHRYYLYCHLDLQQVKKIQKEMQMVKSIVKTGAALYDEDSKGISSGDALAGVLDNTTAMEKYFVDQEVKQKVGRVQKDVGNIVVNMYTLLIAWYGNTRIFNGNIDWGSESSPHWQI